ncbi:MAG: tRNA (cytidine(34)-2'-O)-methyltransferase [Hyphomicrobiales bacterium]
MQIALYQPDIPQNTGTILRLAACLGVPVHLIGPAGFDATDRGLKRAGLDYLAQADIRRHSSFEAFQGWRSGASARLVLLTTRARMPYFRFSFRETDILMLGRESAGVPEDVSQAANARLLIPLRPGMRSLNVAAAAAMVVGEALRQTGGFGR